MTEDEVDEFLAGERTCRAATVSKDGLPHQSALWFVWARGTLWINSVVKSQRWTDISRNPNTSVIIDTGTGFGELRAVVLTGQWARAGDAPRLGPSPEDSEELTEVERLFARKYSGQDELVHDGRHAWLTLTPTKIVSWDFRKMGFPQEARQ